MAVCIGENWPFQAVPIFVDFAICFGFLNALWRNSPEEIVKYLPIAAEHKGISYMT